MPSNLETWQYPAIILATIGVILAAFRTIRGWARREKIIEDHSILLKECAEKESISQDDCEAAQKYCQERQDTNNKMIIAAIKELKDWNKERDQQRHDEMMKMAQSLGRIEGAIGRHYVDR